MRPGGYRIAQRSACQFLTPETHRSNISFASSPLARTTSRCASFRVCLSGIKCYHVHTYQAQSEINGRYARSNGKSQRLRFKRARP